MVEPIAGEIRVAARVIDFLSSGLYENAAACLKELINNSYDADATEVIVAIKPDADVISVEDNGTGMSASQFQKHFDRVAESHKRDDGQTTASGREKIGKIGIGFIAANELCDEMELYSTRKGSSELLHVTIEFGAIRDRSYEERKVGETDVKKGDYHGEILSTRKDESFTRIYMKQLRPAAREQFLRPTTRLGDGSLSLYGLKAESVRDTLAGLESWDELDLYSQTRVRVGLNVPVKYLPDWAPDEYEPALAKLTKKVSKLDFKVIYDGTELYKPTLLLDPRGRSVFKSLSFKGKLVQVEGYLFARHGAYKPRQLNGALIRVRQAAVGEYDDSYLGFPNHLFPLFQDWVTGELYVTGSLDDALNIDRRTFRETHAAYRELQDWFLQEFSQFLADVRADLYTKPSKQRSLDRAENAKSAMREVSTQVREAFGDEVVLRFAETVPIDPSAQTPLTPRDSRRLLRTYTMAEVYEAAVTAASNAGMSEEMASRFLAELGRLLDE